MRAAGWIAASLLGAPLACGTSAPVPSRTPATAAASASESAAASASASVDESGVAMLGSSSGAPIEVALTLGTVSPAASQKVIASGVTKARRELKSCLADAITADPRTPSSLTLGLTLHVDADGDVIDASATVTAPDGGAGASSAKPVAECVRETLLLLSFGQTSAGAFSLPLTLERVPSAITTGEITLVTTAAAVPHAAETLEKARWRFKDCDASALAIAPRAAGVIDVVDTVAPSGLSAGTKVVSSTAPDELTDCVESAVSSIELDAPTAAGATVEVVITIAPPKP